MKGAAVIRQLSSWKNGCSSRLYDIEQWLDAKVARVRLSLEAYGRIIADAVMQINGKPARSHLSEPSDRWTRLRLRHQSNCTLARSSELETRIGLR